MPGTSALWEAETGNHKDLLTLVCLQVKQETLSQRNKVEDDAVRHRHYPLASINIYTHIHEPYTFATHMHVLIKIKLQHFPHPIASSNPYCVISLSFFKVFPQLYFLPLNVLVLFSFIIIVISRHDCRNKWLQILLSLFVVVRVYMILELTTSYWIAQGRGGRSFMGRTHSPLFPVDP